MKRTNMRKLLGTALAVLTAAALLPMGAAAYECKHAELEKGYCEECSTQFAASVDGVPFKSVKEAVKSAKGTTNKEVVLLTDLENAYLNLGAVCLAADDAITVENSRLHGEGSEAVLVSRGEMTLKNVSVVNEKGTYAVLCEENATAEIIGGSYAAQYPVGVRKGTVRMGEEPAKLEAETADLQLEGGLLEIGGKDADGVYQVENRLPGEFAVAIGDAAETVTADWVENISGKAQFIDVNKSWSMSSDITKAVTAQTEGLVYNGKEQSVAVSVALHGRKLLENEDYIITYSGREEDTDVVPMAAGSYELIVAGTGLYSGEYTAAFVIEPAVPVIKWSASTERLPYTAAAAALQSKAQVSLAEGETYEGEVTYSHRTAGAEGDFKSGLPTHAGKYEIKAAVASDANYIAAETEKTLQLTIDKKTVSAPSITLPDVSGGYRFTGSEITPVPVIKDGSAVIPEAEYTVTYTDNVNVGTATVTVAAKDDGNYNFGSKVQKTFEIKKAYQKPLEIGGLPEAVTYGDPSFTLNLAGGSTVAAPVWSVTKGGEFASVNAETGEVTILHAGEVTVQAVKEGNENFEKVSAELSFTVQPAALTVVSAEAENKPFDGEKTVKILGVTLEGVKNNDDVKIAVNDLKGETADAKAGSYTQVTLPELKLSGAAAADYVLTRPAGAVQTAVQIEKAELPAALKEVEAKLPVGTDELIVENIGTVMPDNAGTLTFVNKTQSTAEGTKAIVLQWGVDETGKLTAKIANGKGGDKVYFEVLIKSENYKDAVLKITTAIGAVEIDAAQITATVDGTALTYNGQAQKPAMTVKYGDTVLKAGTDYEITYPEDCTSAGEKEVTLTFKGAYTGEAKAKYTIEKAKVTVTGTKVADKTYNGNTTATVTAGTLTGAVKGDDVKAAASGVFSDKNSGTRTVTVTYKLTGKAAGNYVLTAETETLSAKITPVTTAQLNAGISGVTTANATSDNRYALQNVINQANTALGDKGLSNTEKTNISNVKWNAETIIGRLDQAAAAAATQSILGTKDVTAENVKTENKAALEQAKSELSSALNNYSGNYTVAEEKAIQDKQTRIDAALTVITRVQSAETLINALPDDLETIDTATSEAIKNAKESYDALSDYEKSLISDPVRLKLNAAGLANGVTQPSPTPQQNIQGTDPDETEDDNDTFEFPMWILWVAIIVAALCGLGFVWIKIKRSREKNW